MTNSKDLITDLLTGHASIPQSKLGIIIIVYLRVLGPLYNALTASLFGPFNFVTSFILCTT